MKDIVTVEGNGKEVGVEKANSKCSKKKKTGKKETRESHIQISRQKRQLLQKSLGRDAKKEHARRKAQQKATCKEMKNFNRITNRVTLDCRENLSSSISSALIPNGNEQNLKIALKHNKELFPLH